MGFKLVLCLLLSALVNGVVKGKGIGLHLASRGLLQTHSSLTGRGVSLHPAHAPRHDADDDEHLSPVRHHVLHYAQEGHRPALHGSKHADFKANFTRPTIILDHSNQLLSIKCTDGRINACFKPQGFDKARNTWTMRRFNLATYHVNCGDQTSGKRSYFLAENPQFDTDSGCVEVSATPLADEDAIESGEIEWGTYLETGNTVPVKGHVSVAASGGSSAGASPPPPLAKARSVPLPRRNAPTKEPPTPRHQGPVAPRQTDYTDQGPLPFPAGTFSSDDSTPIDITDDLEALVDFFLRDDFDTSDIDDLVGWFDDLDFIDYNGTVWTDDEDEAGQLDKRRLLRKASEIVHSRKVQKRAWGLFDGIYNAARRVTQTVADYLSRAAQAVRALAAGIISLALVAARIIAVPFGVPFDETYKNDFTFNYTARGEATTRPPPIFGYTEGFNLAGSGGIFNIQCAKCRVVGEFSVEGRLAFSIQSGITEGHIGLVNNQNFNVDAIFGITFEVQYDRPIEALSQQIAAVPLSPMSIPGVVTIGPQLSISGALDLVLNGQAELLIGGSLSIGPGEVRLSLVDREDNAFTGFQATFDPVAQFRGGSLTGAAELGLPISIEVGLDVLNGRFKKTVGLTNKPSIYAAATINLNLPPICRGVTLSVGVKNRVYVTALDLWDYDIRTDILYQRAIGCVTANGFNRLLTVPDLLVLTAVPVAVGGDIANIQPNITDVAARLTTNPVNNLGFKVIMDQDKSSILVSGSDGYVYLVDTESGYDVSSPWGSVNLESGIVNFDVFGRVIAWRPDRHQNFVLEVKVFDPDKVPRNFLAGTFAPVRSSDNSERYVFPLSSPQYTVFFYPTFCKTSSGLRLFVTYYMIDKNGRFHTEASNAQGVRDGLRDFGITNPDANCRTVQLVSA